METQCSPLPLRSRAGVWAVPQLPPHTCCNPSLVTPHSSPLRFDRHGPFDLLIDGANVAFYGANGRNNPSAGQFNWQQIMGMVDLVEKRYPGKKMLLVSD